MSKYFTRFIYVSKLNFKHLEEKILQYYNIVISKNLIWLRTGFLTFFDRYSEREHERYPSKYKFFKQKCQSCPSLKLNCRNELTGTLMDIPMDKT